MKSTWERLEKRKEGFVTDFEFIDNTSVNRNISNLNARNTFELVEKENSKYFLSSNYFRNRYLREQYEKYFRGKFKPTLR